MAPLQVICAGIGRTGTDSLRVALNTLGYNTMHFKNFFYDLSLDPDVFIHAHQHRDQVDWDQVYEKYDAAVDIPTWLWYKDLMKAYPEAKVLLTMRDFDSWYQSVTRIHKNADEMLYTTQPKAPLLKRFELADLIIHKSQLLNPETLKDKEYTREIYTRHYEDVMATVPEDKLLTLELGEGWERLCHFLEKEVPNVPYPKVNSADDHASFMNDVRKSPYFVEVETSSSLIT